MNLTFIAEQFKITDFFGIFESNQHLRKHLKDTCIYDEIVKLSVTFGKDFMLKVK